VYIYIDVYVYIYMHIHIYRLYIYIDEAWRGAQKAFLAEVLLGLTLKPNPNPRARLAGIED